MDEELVKRIIKEYLKDNLSINLFMDEDRDLVYQLKLNEEKLSEGWIIIDSDKLK